MKHFLRGRVRPRCLAWAWVATATAALAQEPSPHVSDSAANDAANPGDISTDRPDQTETPDTIPPGFFQIESGWTHGEDRESGLDSRADAVLETLLRVGLTQRLELRFVSGGYRWERSESEGDTAREDGFADTEIGFKAHLWDERGPRPSAGFLAHLTLPTGADEFSSHRADPSFRFSFAHGLTERWSLGYNLGAAWGTAMEASGDRDTLGAFQYTTSLGYALADTVGVFGEFFGDVPFNEGGGGAHSIDGGITWRPRPNVQFDASIGVGLTREAPDWFVGAGLSWRWPR